MSDGFVAAFGMHHRNTAWNAVQGQMISGSGSSRNMNRNRNQSQTESGYYGQAPCDPCTPVGPCDPCDSCSPCSVSGTGLQVWGNYVGRSDQYGSSYHPQNWKLSMNGVQAGTDICRTQHAQFGVLFGYEGGNMTSADDRIKGDDTYFGAYAAKVFRGGADFRGVFAYGLQKYDMNRLGNSGQFYTSSFKGNTIEAHLELGKRRGRGALTCRPVFAVDMLNNNLNGATETGPVAGEAVVYGKTSLTQVFLRTGTELQCKLDSLTLNGGVFYSYDVNGAGVNTSVKRVEVPTLSAQLAGAKMGRSILSYNLGGACQVSKCFSVLGGYQGEYAFDRSGKGVHSTYFVGGAWVW
jgi:hypothetical protein